MIAKLTDGVMSVVGYFSFRRHIIFKQTKPEISGLYCDIFDFWRTQTYYKFLNEISIMYSRSALHSMYPNVFRQI